MIIDAHAYCFPPLGEANGFADSATHLKYLQREMADHHQPVFCLEDGSPGDNRMLSDPDDLTLRGLHEVDFRSGTHGKFVWTIKGKTYAKQYLPPYLKDLSHPAEMMVAQMDHVGVDRALLHVNPIMGLLNDFTAQCVRDFPNRLLGLASVKEWELEKDPQAALAEVENAYQLGLCGLQFNNSARFRHGITSSWNSKACRHFWDGVTALGKPVFFTIKAEPRPLLEDYLVQLDIWQNWLETYPDTPSVLTHGFPWRLFLHDDHLEIPDAVFRPFLTSSARLQLLFQISLGSVFDYPYLELHSAIAQLGEKLGTDRLMWGTDMPNVERFCNYRQTLDAFRTHCKGLISEQDIANITGKTVQRLFSL